MTQRKSTAEENQAPASREQETWDNIDIHASINQVEMNDGTLPNITARDGFVQRWIRTKIGGEDDPLNLSRATNEHWRRRDPSTIPNDTSAPTIYVDGIGNTVGISGYILMERPVEINDQYEDRVKKRTDAQMKAVDDSLYKEHSADDGFGAVKRAGSSRVSVGGGMPVDD